MNMNKGILLISLVVLTAVLRAQPNLGMAPNRIYNQEPLLIDTWSRVFKIVHIGDSHIQADWFSGRLRTLLQQQYGNAGKGLVFPYRQIKTNGPEGYSAVARAGFTADKIIRCKTACNVGIAAYNAHLPVGGEVVFSLKNDSSSQYISVLFQSANPYSITINDDMDTSHYAIQQTPLYTISSYRNEVAPVFSVQAQDAVNLNGVIANNGNTGILYYTIGANGATFLNYNQSDLFFEQLRALQPDMVIVSLGTNESVSEMTTDSFRVQLAAFQQRLEAVCGESVYLYTTPADNYLRKAVTVRKKVKGRWRNQRAVSYVNNTHLEDIRGAIIDLCNSKHLMYWDLYEAMGGDESMKDWVRSGYAAKDHIHFSKGGYELQGQLLYQALQQILVNP